MKRNLSHTFEENSTVKATLLLPEKLYDEIKALSIKIDFSSLIEKYSHLLEKEGLAIQSSKPTTKYQEKGLKLKRIDFRPLSVDWVIFKIAATGHGISMCLFFAHIMKLELQEFSSQNLLPDRISDNLPSEVKTLTTLENSGTPLIQDSLVECRLVYLGQSQKYRKSFIILRDLRNSDVRNTAYSLNQSQILEKLYI